MCNRGQNTLLRLATSRPNEFLSERSEDLRPRNGRASNEGRLVLTKEFSLKVYWHPEKKSSLRSLTAGFHWRRSRSRSRKRSRKSAYDLVKIKNRSRKRSHKRDGIGVRRIRTFPFLPTPLTTPSLTFRL